jgi:hypothetical protein
MADFYQACIDMDLALAEHEDALRETSRLVRELTESLRTPATMQRFHVYLGGCPTESPDFAFFDRASAESKARSLSKEADDAVAVIDSDDGSTVAMFDGGNRAPIDWEAP